jgi:hypothetical protein
VNPIGDGMVLRCVGTAGPADWAATALQERYDRWAACDADNAGGNATASGSWMSVADVLADDCAWLRALHPRVMAAASAPPDTVASYLAGWYAGAIADVVGYALATAGAGLLLGSGDIRLQVHPDGWIDRVELASPVAAVPVGHPWVGRHGIDVVDVVDVVDVDEMLRRCVAALVAVVSPIIDGCHGLARVGRAGLWNEVGDSLGLAFDDTAPANESVRELLMAAVAVPGAPWRARPSIEIVDDEVLGLVMLRRKGGCCLAYQCERFGSDDGPRYCTTCKFRDPDDSRARQLVWRRLDVTR